MKKKILFYRHAKSNWDITDEEDLVRPLSNRGMRSAEVMGKVLASSTQVPAFAVSSHAVRAESTLDISMVSGNWNCIKSVNEALYHGNSADIIQMIKGMDDRFKSVMLVGHEPTFSGLISYLIGGGNIVMPTAAIARLDFNIPSWKELHSGHADLRWLLQPAFFMKGKNKF